MATIGDGLVRLAAIKKQTLTLSDILAEFESNRLGKLMFRTVVKSFFSKDRRTDGRASRLTTQNIFVRREKNAKNLC